MSDRIPKIVFKYAYPLDMECRRKFADEIPDYPEEKEIKETIIEWRKLWAEINAGDKLLKEITELTGVEDQIDITAFIIGGGFLAKSSPLLLPITSTRRASEDKKTELLIHEILHNFVSGRKNYWSIIREKYNGESKKTQNHIIIYALLERILANILPDTDVKDLISEGWDDYYRALEIAREEDPDEIIAEFRELTQEGNE